MRDDEPQDVLTVGSDGPSPRGRVLLALVAAVVLGLSGYSLLNAGADSEAETQPASLDAPTGGTGPSGPESLRSSGGQAPVVYAVGSTLHAPAGDLTVHGPDVGTRTVVRVRGTAASGWLVSLEKPRAHGVVDLTGEFHPWPVTGFAGTGPAITSPDDTQVLAVVDGRTQILDLASGRAQRTLPRGRAVGWTTHGIHLLSAGGAVRVWDPDGRATRRTFDATACVGDATAVAAAVAAGWDRCRHPDLLAVSSTGRAVFAVRTPQGLRVATPSGQVLEPEVHEGSDGVRRVEGAVFRGEDQVVLGLAERSDGRVVSAFVSCSLSAGSCERITDPLPAAQGPGAHFLVTPPCEDERRASGTV